MRINFKEIPKDGELWELFSRDFLQAIGFYIASSVDRGPDGKKDLIVSELLSGYLGNYKFKWLVSCKHNANRAKSNSVREEDEPNILERVKGFNCDGFLGMYSTLPSSGLNNRLNQLKDNGEIKDFRIFDYKHIEDYLLRIGYSELLLRYFPESYKKIKPLHLILDEYVPLNCISCGKDILHEMYANEYCANVVQVMDSSREDVAHHVHEMYWVCKGECDTKMEKYYWKNYNMITGWEDIEDIAKPTLFLRYILSAMNQMESDDYSYSENAYKNLKHFIMGISQKALREMTGEEKKRARELITYSL